MPQIENTIAPPGGYTQQGESTAPDEPTFANAGVAERTLIALSTIFASGMVANALWIAWASVS